MRWLVLAVLASFATPAVAADQRNAVYAVAKRVIAAFDGGDLGTRLEATWPDGYHSITRRDRGEPALRRHWRDVPNHGRGVLFETRLGKPSITIHGDRADVNVRYNYYVRYDVDEKPSQCGRGTYRFDVRRRRGEWRVLNLADVILQSSDRC